MAHLSKAEKQRLYRSRLNADPQRRQQYLEKKKQKYVSDRLSGKRRSANSMTPREKRLQRKLWRSQQRRSRERKKHVQNILSPPQSPPEHELNSSQGERQRRQGRRLIARNRTALHRRNTKLQEALDQARREVARYKMRYSRLKRKADMSDSPRSKANRLLRHWKNGKTGPPEKAQTGNRVKRSLTFHFALLESIKRHYQNTKHCREKVMVKRMISDKIIKKYKLKSVLANAIGLTRLGGSKSSAQRQGRKSGFFKTAEKVRGFLCRDDVSRLAAGKKNTITVRKVKKQRRILTDSMKNLHLKFLSESTHPVSYSSFCKLRPFWVTPPKESDRETCLCLIHENFQFIVNSLYSCGIIETKDVNDIVKSVVCSENSKECAYDSCINCKQTSYSFSRKPSNGVTVNFWQWERQRMYRTIKDSSEMTGFLVTKKCEKSLTEENLGQLFQSILSKFKRHVFNIRWQFHMYRRCRQTLKSNECMIHVDFSEDYQCRYSSEVQSVHFGASHNHACLHTGVLYIPDAENAIPFCSISDSTRHDPPAIWAHLDPILDMIRNRHPNITVLHFFSDSPSTQYRQKANFHLMSTEPFEKGFKEVSWNFFEAGHWKGAPDGVGGTVKRTADMLSRRGTDVTDALVLYTELVSYTSIQLFYVDSSEVNTMSEKLSSAGQLQPVPGTMRLHQVLSLSSGCLKVREVSCFCCQGEEKLDCPCFSLKDAHVLTAATDGNTYGSESTDHYSSVSVDPKDVGKWCIVKYDNRAYPGIILEVDNDDIQVKAMESVGDNRFFWPGRDDINWYPKDGVMCFIDEPTYASRRNVMVEKKVWKSVQDKLS